MLPELNDLLSYKSSDVLNRYHKDYPNNNLKPEEAFVELMKYFWLVNKHEIDLQLNPNKKHLQFECSMHVEMKEIDDMWHTFLLFTREYKDFCQQYFEKFIDHAPNVGTDSVSANEFKTDLSRYLSYIYDNLGEETVRKWFHELETQKL